MGRHLALWQVKEEAPRGRGAQGWDEEGPCSKADANADAVVSKRHNPTKGAKE